MTVPAYGMEFQIAMIPGGIGYLELLFLFTLILVLFGPERLPRIARTIGHLMEQLRRAAALFQHNLLSMEDESDAALPSAQPQPARVPPADNGEDKDGPAC
ncbi:MAG: twin-arginine translocase TatA/TatE family subunit [Kiritimatiellia bacterium]